MTIEEAVKSLENHLGEPDVFHVHHRDGVIIVDVNYIYRTSDVLALGDAWEGYPISTGRRSCW